MKIVKFEIDKKDPKLRQSPFLLAELNGNGCGLKECNCSPPNFISVSNDKIGFEVILTDEEAKELKISGKLEIEI